MGEKMDKPFSKRGDPTEAEKMRKFGAISQMERSLLKE